jgi:hypothetical protein
MQKPQDSPGSQSISKYHKFIWVGLLLSFVALAYSNIFANDFLFDDEFLIIKNQHLRSWKGVIDAFFSYSTGGAGGVDSFYRPLQTVLYVFAYQLAGLETWAYHILSLSLHLFNVFLVYSIGKKLKLRPPTAFLIALLWGVHPINTEAVTYMSATGDSGYVFCLLNGIHIWLEAWLDEKSGVSRTTYFLCILSFLAGLLFKESAIVFPGLLFSLWPLIRIQKNSPWQKYLQGLLPFFGLAGVYFLIRKSLVGVQFYPIANLYTENWIYRLYTALATIPKYLELLVWPHDLHMERQFPVYIEIASTLPILGLLFVMILVCGSLLLKKNWQALFAFSFLWFFAAHSPHMGIALPVNSLFLEHWMYLPVLGFFWTLGLFWDCLSLRSAALILPLALAAYWGSLTFKQNTLWKDPLSFYGNILHYEPKVARVHNNYAMALAEAGLTQEAIEHYQTAIEISDIYPQTHHNLGLQFLKIGRVEDSILEFKNALTMDPDFFYSSKQLYEVYKARGQSAEADKYFTKFQESMLRRGIQPPEH